MKLTTPEQEHGRHFVAVFTIGDSTDKHMIGFQYNSRYFGSPYEQAENVSRAHAAKMLCAPDNIDVIRKGE